jgi:hypothetical protein
MESDWLTPPRRISEGYMESWHLEVRASSSEARGDLTKHIGIFGLLKSAMEN